MLEKCVYGNACGFSSLQSEKRGLVYIIPRFQIPQVITSATTGIYRILQAPTGIVLQDTFPSVLKIRQ